MSETYTPTPTAQTGGVTMVEDGDPLDVAGIRLSIEENSDAIDKLQADSLATGAPGGTNGTNARSLSFAEGALYGIRNRVLSVAVDPTPGTGSLDTGGSTATPVEAAYDEYFLTGDLEGDGPVTLQINIDTANNSNQHGRRIRIHRRTTENDYTGFSSGGNAVITIEYLVDGAAAVAVATLGFQQPVDSMGVSLGEQIGIGWGWVDLTFVPSLSRWRCTAWGGGGRPVYA